MKEQKEQKCKPGFRWCPIQKKCLPEDQVKGKGRRQARGKGEGPMGQPVKPGTQRPMGQPRRTQEAIELVDIILDGDYKEYKVIEDLMGLTDQLIDEVENRLDSVPDQDMASLYKTVFDELSTDSMTSIEESMVNTVRQLIKEKDYREFFKGMLKKWNINSPAELSDEKKKEFFDKVDKGWKAKKETD